MVGSTTQRNMTASSIRACVRRTWSHDQVLEINSNMDHTYGIQCREFAVFGQASEFQNILLAKKVEMTKQLLMELKGMRGWGKNQKTYCSASQASATVVWHWLRLLFIF
jgi:hypothetical protein